MSLLRHTFRNYSNGVNPNTNELPHNKKRWKWVTGLFSLRACFHYIMCDWRGWPWSLVCVTVSIRLGPPCPQALVTVVCLWKRVPLVFTAGGSHCNKDMLNGAQKDQMCLCSLGIKKHLGWVTDSHNFWSSYRIMFTDRNQILPWSLLCQRMWWSLMKQTVDSHICFVVHF